MFLHYYCASWIIFGFLAVLSYFFKAYEIFPGFGLIAYTSIIGLLLAALNEANKKPHYLLVSFGLILYGAIASIDIVLSRNEMIALWMTYDWFPADQTHVDGYIQVVIVLLNIFTGSLAANCLFYGLNDKNF